MSAKKTTSSKHTAGYSGTPLPRKLGIRDNFSVMVLNPPDQFERTLGPLPAYTKIIGDPTNANVTILFAMSLSELVRDFRPLAKALPEKTPYGSPGQRKLPE